MTDLFDFDCDGLWGIGLEELSDANTTEDNGVLHRGPDFEKENDYGEDS